MASKSEEGHWSEPLTLRKLVEDRLFPSLIRLEEGTRGKEERLSFSSGDIMALQGSVAVKDKPLILAHYMNDSSIKDWVPTKDHTEMYRALIILPVDNTDVANLSISIFIDPSGDVYHQYISTRFSDCNWIDREHELLVALGEEDDLDDIHEYLNLEEEMEDYRNIDEEAKQKEESSRPTKPPKTLPKPKPKPKPKSGFTRADDFGHEDEKARQEFHPSSQEKRRPPPMKPTGRVEENPPPRPPRLLKNTLSCPEGPSTRLDPNREPSLSPTAPPPLPPRCHKLSDSAVPPRVLTGERSPTSVSCDRGDPSSVSPEASGQSSMVDASGCLQVGWSQGFTFAEMAVPGEPTYVLPPPHNEGSRQTHGGLIKKIKKIKNVKKFIKFSKGHGQVDDADKGKGQIKEKNPKVRRGKASFYQNINCKKDSPDEQLKTEDEDQEGHDDQDDSGEDEYEEIDETLLEDPRLAGDGGMGHEMAARDKKSKREAPEDKPTMWVLPQQTLPESPSRSEERLHADVKGHAYPNKATEYGKTSGPEAGENMCNMSVKELCACLNRCGMGHLAEVCEQNILDGNFLHSTPDRALTCEPFCLNSFDLVKLKHIKDGWRPNVGR